MIMTFLAPRTTIEAKPRCEANERSTILDTLTHVLIAAVSYSERTPRPLTGAGSSGTVFS